MKVLTKLNIIDHYYQLVVNFTNGLDDIVSHGNHPGAIAALEIRFVNQFAISLARITICPLSGMPQMAYDQASVLPPGIV